MLDPAELATKSIYELRIMLNEAGASWHHREKPATLAERLNELTAAVQPHQKQPPVVVANVQAKIVPLTQAAVQSTLESQLESGLLLRFRDGTWEMRYRDKHDSGSMTMPLMTVVRCADSIMRNKAPLCGSCKVEMTYTASAGYHCPKPACAKIAKPQNPEGVRRG
jgi:hypothetical protein